MSRDAPGRNCPLSYRYPPDVFRRAPEVEAETLYVIGGLYGNPFALDAILEFAVQETPAPTLVFNGDFNWFDVDPGGFAALRGNVDFRGTRFGLVTRISTAGRADALYGERFGPLFVGTLAVRYDHGRWLAQFDRLWPAGSPAAVSYRKRITDGPGYDPAQAVRRAVRSPAALRQNAATG